MGRRDSTESMVLAYELASLVAVYWLTVSQFRKCSTTPDAPMCSSLQLQHITADGLVHACAKVVRVVLHMLQQLPVWVQYNFLLANYVTLVYITKNVFLGRMSAMEAAKMQHRWLKHVGFALVSMLTGFTIRPVNGWHTWIAWVMVHSYVRVMFGCAKDRFASLNQLQRVDMWRSVRAYALMLCMESLICVWALYWIFAFSNKCSSVLRGTDAWQWIYLFDSAVVACDGARGVLKHGMTLMEWIAEHRSSHDDHMTASHGMLTSSPSSASSDLDAANGSGIFVAADRKNQIVYYVDLFADIVVYVCMLVKGAIMWSYIGIHFRFVEACRLLSMATYVHVLVSRVKVHARWLAINRALTDRFAAASEADLQRSDHMCQICLFDMRNGLKLPCNHVFHQSCLRSWWQSINTVRNASNAAAFRCPLCQTAFDMDRAAGRAIAANAVDHVDGSTRDDDDAFDDSHVSASLMTSQRMPSFAAGGSDAVFACIDSRRTSFKCECAPDAQPHAHNQSMRMRRDASQRPQPSAKAVWERSAARSISISQSVVSSFADPFHSEAGSDSEDEVSSARRLRRSNRRPQRQGQHECCDTATSHRGSSLQDEVKCERMDVAVKIPVRISSAPKRGAAPRSSDTQGSLYEGRLRSSTRKQL